MRAVIIVVLLVGLVNGNFRMHDGHESDGEDGVGNDDLGGSSSDDESGDLGGSTSGDQGGSMSGDQNEDQGGSMSEGQSGGQSGSSDGQTSGSNGQQTQASAKPQDTSSAGLIAELQEKIARVREIIQKIQGVITPFRFGRSIQDDIPDEFKKHKPGPGYSSSVQW